jgi:hypothetical protein
MGWICEVNNLIPFKGMCEVVVGVASQYMVIS